MLQVDELQKMKCLGPISHMLSITPSTLLNILMSVTKIVKTVHNVNTSLGSSLLI